MATYSGRRDRRHASVTVDGEPLPPRNDLVDHSPDGFSWGYAGSGPSQLALALLAHHFCAEGDSQDLTDSKTRLLHLDVKAQLVSALPAAG